MTLCVCGHDREQHRQFDEGEYCFDCMGSCLRYRKAANEDSLTAILSAGVTPEGLAREKVAEVVKRIREYQGYYFPDQEEWDRFQRFLDEI